MNFGFLISDTLTPDVENQNENKYISKIFDRRALLALNVVEA